MDCLASTTVYNLALLDDEQVAELLSQVDENGYVCTTTLKSSENPLFYAVRNEYDEKICIEWLHRSNSNVINSQGQTILHISAMKLKSFLFTVAVKSKVNVNVIDANNDTALRVS